MFRAPARKSKKRGRAATTSVSLNARLNRMSAHLNRMSYLCLQNESQLISLRPKSIFVQYFLYWGSICRFQKLSRVRGLGCPCVSSMWMHVIDCHKHRLHFFLPPAQRLLVCGPSLQRVTVGVLSPFHFFNHLSVCDAACVAVLQRELQCVLQRVSTVPLRQPLVCAFPKTTHRALIQCKYFLQRNLTTSKNRYSG